MYKLYVYLNGAWGIYTYHNQNDRATTIAMLNKHGIEWIIRD